MRLVILVTASSRKEAEKIARGLIQVKIAACVNIIANLKSLFWWKGKIERANECLLIIKTTKKNLNKAIKKVKSLHSYETPEIIFLPISGGYRPYLNWIDESCE